MDGQESAKCRKSKLGDIDGIMIFVLNDNKTKTVIVSSPTFIKRSQNLGKRGGGCSSHFFLCFSERVSSLSLDLRAIRPSEFF